MNSPSDIQFPVLLTIEEATQGAHRDFMYARRHLLCAECEGSGRTEEGRCDACQGTGGSFLPRKVTVTIPPGVDNHTRIRLRGHGLLNADANAWGDLYLICYLRTHARLKRSGYDLAVQVPAAAPQPGRVPVSGPSGLFALDWPAGVRGMLRVPGQGLYRGVGSGERGDLLVELVPAPDAEAQRRFPEWKAEARAFLAAGQPSRVVERLGKPELEPLWDAEAHALLGMAHTQAGACGLGLEHLGKAADAEPDQPGHRLHMAMAAYRLGRTLTACLHLEAALQRERTPAKIRPTLTRILEQTFAEAARPYAAVPAFVAALQQAGNLAGQRAYTQSENLLCDLEEQIRGAGIPELRRLRALTLLLACLSGGEAGVPAAVQLLEDVAIDAAVPLHAEEAREAAREFLERDCRLPGLLALAATAVAAGNWGRARFAAHQAARVARTYAARILQMPTDPLAVWEDEFIRTQLRQLFAALEARATQPEASAVRGLGHLVEAHYRMRTHGDVKAGWAAAVQAVQRLEIAVCLTPDDATVQQQFEAAVDLLAAMAAAVQGEEPADAAEFYQNTCDAAIARLIPGAPLNELASPTHLSPQLKAIAHSAFGNLFTGGRKLLSGEFLIAATEDYFALTNYRLLLPTDELYGPQVLPLNAIDRFHVRTAGLNVSTLVIGLGNGRQHAVNNVPNGTFPPEAVMNYLIAARMWERLGPADQETLARGRPAPVAASVAPQLAAPSARALAAPVPAAALPAPAPALGAGAAPGPPSDACAQCGNQARPGDVFCRRCGSRLGGSVEVVRPILPLEG